MGINYHKKEYKPARRRFMITVFSLFFAVYALTTFIVGDAIGGWWLVGICAGAVLLELFLWINIGLPRAARKGSPEFKRAYFGE